TTNLVLVKVADNGSPSLSATQEFSVMVNPLIGPSVTQLGFANSELHLNITGDPGPDYTVEASTNLTNWSVLLTTNSPTLPFDWTDTNAASFLQRFYRVILGP